MQKSFKYDNANEYFGSAFYIARVGFGVATQIPYSNRIAHSIDSIKKLKIALVAACLPASLALKSAEGRKVGKLIFSHPRRLFRMRDLTNPTGPSMRLFLRLMPSLLLISVAGCASAPVQVDAPPIQPPVPKVLDPKAQKIEMLLQRADTALAMQALTEPVSENAYDLYRAVLVLEPTNIRGQEGLKNVAAAFPAQVEEAIVGKQYDAALRKLQKGLIIFPANQQLKQMESQVRAAKQVRAQAAAKTTTVALSPTELTAKSGAIEVTLRNLAKRAAVSNELLIINARNDAEGRWIYKTMKDAVGSRLRGDIKISSTPSIQLSPSTL